MSEPLTNGTCRTCGSEWHAGHVCAMPGSMSDLGEQAEWLRGYVTSDEIGPGLVRRIVIESEANADIEEPPFPVVVLSSSPTGGAQPTHPDTERLDWLERERVTVSPPPDNAEAFSPDDVWALAQRRAPRFVYRPTLREAIDAARTPDTGK